MGIQHFLAERRFRKLIRTVLDERSSQLKRADAASQLSALGDTRAFEPMHTAWESMTSESDRKAICPSIFTLASKLAQAGDRNAVKCVEDLMYRAETTSEIKVAACRCIAAREGTDGLLRLVESRNPGVRTLAIDEMGESRHPRLFDVLAKTVASDAQCRYTATRWLRKSGDAKALEPLADGLAQELRANNHWHPFPFQKYESPNEMALQDALRELASKTETDVLLPLLKDLPTNVYHAGGRLVLAVFAAETLAARKEHRAVDRLMAAYDYWVIRTNGPHDEHHAAASLSTAFANALGALGDKSAIPSLLAGIGCLRDDVRGAAAGALTKLGESSWQGINGSHHDYVVIAESGCPRSFDLLMNLMWEANSALCLGMANGREMPSIAHALVTLGDPRTIEETGKLYGIERAGGTLHEALEILAVMSPWTPERLSKN